MSQAWPIMGHTNYTTLNKCYWLGGKFKQRSKGVVFGLGHIYTLCGSDMVLFVCLLFHAFASIQHCKGQLHVRL